MSVFRVKKFFDKIEVSSKSLYDWSYAGKASDDAIAAKTALPENWAVTMPVKIGGILEADLDGAFFPASVIRIEGNSYDVLFFDGDKDEGLDRSMLKLVKPPVMEEDADTPAMTPKQLKRWKKEQKKKN